MTPIFFVMDTCKVCQTNYKMGRASRNYDFEGYCSRYCYEFEKQKLSKEIKLCDKSAVIHKIEVWPEISVVCQTCNQDFTLKYSHSYYRNSWFCGRECLKQVEIHHKGMRNYHYLLPLYRSQEWMSASEIASSNKYRIIDSKGSRSIANFLTLWASRGILKVDKSKQPFTYLWNYNGPVGHAMNNYKSI